MVVQEKKLLERAEFLIEESYSLGTSGQTIITQYFTAIQSSDERHKPTKAHAHHED